MERCIFIRAKSRTVSGPGRPPDKVAKEKSKPAPLETTRMRHPTLFLHSICRPPAGCGEGHGLPRSLRPGEAHGTQNARSVADVRAARTEEKAGHSGRDDCAEEERTHPCKYQRRKGRPPRFTKFKSLGRSSGYVSRLRRLGHWGWFAQP